MQKPKARLLLDTNAWITLMARTTPEEHQGKEPSEFDLNEQKVSKIPPAKLRAKLVEVIAKDDVEIIVPKEVLREVSDFFLFNSDNKMSKGNRKDFKRLLYNLASIAAYTDPKVQNLKRSTVFLHNSKISELKKTEATSPEMRKLKYKMDKDRINSIPMSNFDWARTPPEQIKAMKDEINYLYQEIEKPLPPKERKQALERIEELQEKSEPKLWTDLLLILRARSWIKEGIPTQIISRDSDMETLGNLYDVPVAHSTVYSPYEVSPEEFLDALEKKRKKSKKPKQETDLDYV